MTTPLQTFRRKKTWSTRVMAAELTKALRWEAPAIPVPPVSCSLVSKWERGLMTPSLGHALAIRKVCGRAVPLESLVVWR